MQTFYFLSLLQKLAAPKEFMLGEEQLAALIDADGSETFLNPFLGHTTGIDPLDNITESPLRATLPESTLPVFPRSQMEPTMTRLSMLLAATLLAGCAAHAVPKLVYVSSASVVYEGRDIENGDEGLPYAGVSQAPYADSKVAAEKDVLAAHDSATLKTCAPTRAT